MQDLVFVAAAINPFIKNSIPIIDNRGGTFHGINPSMSLIPADLEQINHDPPKKWYISIVTNKTLYNEKKIGI